MALLPLVFPLLASNCRRGPDKALWAITCMCTALYSRRWAASLGTAAAAFGLSHTDPSLLALLLAILLLLKQSVAMRRLYDSQCSRGSL